MKKYFYLLMISLILISTSCDWILGPEDDDVTKTELRNAYDVLIEANAVKQSGMYDVIKAFTNDYNNSFLEKDLTYEQIDAVFVALYKPLQYEEDVLAAIDVIENESGSIFFQQKLNKSNSYLGIGSAMKDFFTWASGSGKRSRNRILTVASNMPESERKKLYDNLRPEWKKDIDSEKDFWEKMENGDLDNKAPQMYNDFYHDAESDFPYIAQDKDLTIQKIVVKEGAEGISKGAAVVIETTKLVSPGLGEGMDMAEKGLEYVEKAEKAYKNPKEFIKDEIKGKIAEKIGGFVDVDGAIEATGLGDDAGTALKTLLDAALGSDDPADWVKETMDWGIAKIVDSDKDGKKADIAIAENQDKDAQTQIIIGVGSEEVEGNSEITMGLPSGIWNIKVADIEGYIDEVVTEIQEKIETLVLTSTDSEGDHQKGEYSLSVWISPANPGPNQSVTAYAKIYPPTAGVEIHFTVSGTDGYSNEITNTTDSEGNVSFYIPGGAEDVQDHLTFTIVETGLTRSLSYTF
jgi:hypothetical protein